MKQLVALLGLLVLVAGCSGRQDKALGAAFANATPTAIVALHSSSAPVVIQGQMIDKCPISGCWFVVKDRTGVIRVDTKASTFVVAEVPLHSEVTVYGKLQTSPRQIAATGVRY